MRELDHLFSSFSVKLISKMSSLVLAEILGVFLNTLTDDDKYPVQHCENLRLPIQIQLSKQPKTFSQFFFHFWNLHQILNILKKKLIVIANVFPLLQSVTNFVEPLSKERRFRTRFGSQHVKASQIFAISPWERFYHLFSSFSGKLIWKMSHLVLGGILGVFVDTLTAHGAYPIQYW